MENVLTLGKLLSLWFRFLLHSILFLISQTFYRTYKIISSYELARPIMGTIFLVDLPPKFHDCGSRYALTWRESPERAWAARAEMPTQHVWNFAAILLVRRRRPFSFFYLWARKEKWSGVSSTIGLVHARARNYQNVMIQSFASQNLPIAKA